MKHKTRQDHGQPKPLVNEIPRSKDRWEPSKSIYKTGLPGCRWVCGNVVSCGFATVDYWEWDRHRCNP